LLDAIPSLRFIKLEHRSPSMAQSANIAPLIAGMPISGATSAVTDREDTIPRTVLVLPKKGRLSRNNRPPSRGWAKRSCKTIFVNIGVPFAMRSKNNKDTVIVINNPDEIQDVIHLICLLSC